MRRCAHLNGRGQRNPGTPIEHHRQQPASGPASGTRRFTDASHEHYRRGGAAPLLTARTVAHWFGTTLNPDNGVTYGYNMIGADPNNCSGSECDVTVTVDITPVNVIVDGESFNGSDALSATLASPVFATNDYGSTLAATAAGNSRG